ncbi:hypothetical protein ACFCWY_08540 [Streptomyces sp. NPDC056362]|uniref:hypothetical protein n=1 Tax=unclassified Streptomyces TaxID=2593676 RepID=UPI0035E1C95D
MPRPVHVTAQDIEAAATLASRLARTTTGFVDLLFNSSATGPDRHINARHRAAVGMVLTWNSANRWSAGEDDARMLRVIRATGRVHQRPDSKVPVTQTGVIMLGGEVAARYLYRRLALERGPYGLEPFAAAIGSLWRLPEEELPHVHGHPPMALLRLTTGPYKGLFHHTDVEAMRCLAYALPGSGRSEQQGLLSVARIADAVTRHRGRFQGEDLAVVREAVLTARTTGEPQPVLAAAMS